IGPVGDYPRDDVAAFFQFREPNAALDHFAGGERPIGCKSFLQLYHHRAFDSKMQIANGALGFIGEDVSMADVDTAGESRLAVHNKNFAVIAKIESRHAPRRE